MWILQYEYESKGAKWEEKPEKEVMVVVDDEDEEEGEKKTNLPTYSTRRWPRRSHSTWRILS